MTHHFPADYHPLDGSKAIPIYPEKSVYFFYSFLLRKINLLLAFFYPLEFGNKFF